MNRAGGGQSPRTKSATARRRDPLRNERGVDAVRAVCLTRKMNRRGPPVLDGHRSVRRGRRRHHRHRRGGRKRSCCCCCPADLVLPRRWLEQPSLRRGTGQSGVPMIRTRGKDISGTEWRNGKSRTCCCGDGRCSCCCCCCVRCVLSLYDWSQQLCEADLLFTSRSCRRWGWYGRLR